MNPLIAPLEPLVIDTWNAALAGKPASATFAASLSKEWLPALSLLLRRDGRQGARWLAARQLLARLGRLLQLLPVRGRDALIDSSVKAFRQDLQLQAASWFDDEARCRQVLKQVDDELLLALRAAAPTPGTAVVSRAPLAPITGSTSAVAATRPSSSDNHPHDRGVSGTGRTVLSDSRNRRRGEHEAMTAMECVASLREGDRIALLMPGGIRQTWRVLRSAVNRQNLLMENEDTHRQGVLGLQSLAAQMEEGRLAILA